MNTKRFNIFLFKYLLAEGLNANKEEGVYIKMAPTCLPEDADTFFKKINIGDKKSYLKFSTEACRVDICTDNSVDTFYLFFRNKREDRKDINRTSYSFTKPSSVELGFVGVDGAFNSIYKKHYQDLYGNDNLEASTEAEGLKVLKTLEYEIVNIIFSRVNINGGVEIPLRPMDAEGKAIIKKVAKNTVSKITTTDKVDPEIQNIMNKIN